jgi:hypothetical protein
MGVVRGDTRDPGLSCLGWPGRLDGGGLDDTEEQPMSTSLDELFPGEQEVDVPSAEPRSTAGKSIFTVALLVVGAILAVVVGTTGVGLVANAFGVGLDARYCDLQTATTCSSVSVPAINEATGAGLPDTAEVAESSWFQTPASAALHALVESPEPGWTPPVSAYEECGSLAPCTGETPSSFEDRGIRVTSEMVPRLNVGGDTQRRVFLGEDADGREWVAAVYLLDR